MSLLLEHLIELVALCAPFSRCLPSVAVRAPYITLRNLGLDRAPGHAGRHEDRDVRSLLASDVVEVEHDWVRFSAVHTGMCEEVVEELRRYLGPHA